MRTPPLLVAASSVILAYAWPALTIVAGGLAEFPVSRSMILAEFAAALSLGPFIAWALLRPPVPELILHALGALASLTTLMVVSVGLLAAMHVLGHGFSDSLEAGAMEGLAILGLFLMPAATLVLVQTASAAL